jgi:transposase
VLALLFGTGSKHRMITDAKGVPLACLLAGANRHDVTQLLPLVEAIPPVRGKRGRPRRRPKTLIADRGYDSQPHRQALGARGITPIIAKRNTEHGSRLGSERWVVERTLSWLHQHRRLRIRHEQRVYEALLSLARSLICFRQLKCSLLVRRSNSRRPARNFVSRRRPARACGWCERAFAKWRIEPLPHGVRSSCRY